jgi:hypothetical protein
VKEEQYEGGVEEHIDDVVTEGISPADCVVDRVGDQQQRPIHRHVWIGGEGTAIDEVRWQGRQQTNRLVSFNGVWVVEVKPIVKAVAIDE